MAEFVDRVFVVQYYAQVLALLNIFRNYERN